MINNEREQIAFANLSWRPCDIANEINYHLLMLDVDQRLRDHGLKVTAPRVSVLDVLRQATGHLNADEVHARLGMAGLEIGRATVYRVLAQLEQVGLVQRSVLEAGRSVFEISRGPRHDHLVCTRCARVIDFSDAEIEARRIEAAGSKGFVVVDHRLVLLGHCAACRAVTGSA